MVSCLVCGLKLDWKCRPSLFPPHGFHPVVLWFPPRSVMVSTPYGVVVSCLVFGSKLDWKCCPLWCHGFHPCDVVVSCLIHGLKLDRKFVSVVSPKWHHGVVSFSSRKQQTLTLKSCDHSFQPIRRLHSVKSHTSLEKLWDFMQKEFPFEEQSCETALLKNQPCLNHFIYTPLPPAKHCRYADTYSTGTVRWSRWGLPQAVTKKSLKMKKGEAVFRWKDYLLCLKVVDKRPVIMLSSQHNAVQSFVKNNYLGKPITKPVLIRTTINLWGLLTIVTIS